MKSLERGIAIMKYLAVRKSAGVTEIAEEFGIDKSTASRILSSLKKQDILYQNAQNQKYSLSVGALLFSHRLMSTHAIINIAQPILQELMMQTHETAHLCALHNDQIYVLSQLKSPENQFMSDACLPGMIEPFHCSAVGKAILANMLPSDARVLLERSEMTSYTENTIIDINELLRQFEIIRKNGYAIDDGEYAKGIFYMAVPVFDYYGYPTFSLGISGFQNSIASRPRFEANLSKLQNAANKLTTDYSRYVKARHEQSRDFYTV